MPLHQFPSITHFKSTLPISIVTDKESSITAPDTEIPSYCITNTHLKKIAINLFFRNHILLEILACFKTYLQGPRNRLRSGGKILSFILIMENMKKLRNRIKTSIATKTNLTLKVMTTAAKATSKTMIVKTKEILDKKIDELLLEWILIPESNNN